MTNMLHSVNFNMLHNSSYYCTQSSLTHDVTETCQQCSRSPTIWQPRFDSSCYTSSLLNLF